MAEQVVFKRVRPDAPPVEMWVYEDTQCTKRAKRLIFGVWMDPTGDAERASLFHGKGITTITGVVLENAVARGEATAIPIEMFSKRWKIEYITWAALVSAREVEVIADAAGDALATKFVPKINRLVSGCALVKITGPGTEFYDWNACTDVTLGGEVDVFVEHQQYTIAAAGVKAFNAMRDRYVAGANMLGDEHAVAGDGMLTRSSVVKEASSKLLAAARKEAAERERIAAAEREQQEAARLRVEKGGATSVMSNEQYAAFMREQRAKKKAGAR